MIELPNWPKIAIKSPLRKANLNIMQKLLQIILDPESRIPPVIHVAGTNGKGSTIAMLRSIFEYSGYKVHTYTSPHLIEFNERITLAGKKISDSYLDDVLSRTKKAAEKTNIDPSFFEGITAAAFLAFSEVKADILLLETGMGGRLDPTNVIPQPLLTIITSISHDHTEHLGDTLEKITFEKAGIIKPNTPCIIGKQSDDGIYKQLIKRCEELKSPCFVYEHDFICKKSLNNMSYFSQKYNLNLPLPNLEGSHQIDNSAAVIAASMLLNNCFKIPQNAIIEALENIIWPGRLEKISSAISESLIGENIEIYLDGAHNPSGSERLAKWIKEDNKTDICLVLGMTDNRDVSKFLLPLKDLISYGYSTIVSSEPSSMTASVLAKKANDIEFEFFEGGVLSEVFDKIKNQSKKPSIILITGSLFLVSDFYKIK